MTAVRGPDQGPMLCRVQHWGFKTRQQRNLTIENRTQGFYSLCRHQLVLCRFNELFRCYLWQRGARVSSQRVTFCPRIGLDCLEISTGSWQPKTQYQIQPRVATGRLAWLQKMVSFRLWILHYKEPSLGSPSLITESFTCTRFPCHYS
jgi:hypothetical protein